MSTAPDSLSPALERVLEKFGGIVRRVCWRYRFMGAEVDELMQEVRIRLWHAHGGQEHADEHIAAIPASYLHRTALSAAVDLLRQRRARRADQMVSIDDEPEGMRETPGPDLALAESELAEQIERGARMSFPVRGSKAMPYLGAWVGRRGLSSTVENFETGEQSDLSLSGLAAGVSGGVQFFLSPGLALDGGLSVGMGKMGNVKVDGVRVDAPSFRNTTTTRLQFGASWYP